MTPRDVPLALLLLAVPLFLLAAYILRVWKPTCRRAASCLVLSVAVFLAFPVFVPNDPHFAGTNGRAFAGVQQRPPSPSVGEDVYFKIEGPISGPPAPHLTARDYPQIALPWPFGESRIVMWVLGQQHLYFGAFVLGALFWIMGLELRGLLAQKPEAAQRYDRAAQDVLGLVVLAVSGAAISGAVLLLAFVSLYPDFAQYLIGVFRPFVWLYGLLFVAFSVAIYLYYYTWHQMASGSAKWIHATLGVVINLIGNIIMMVGSSWGSFMMSPAGVDERGRFLGDHVRVLHHALWNPLNVHRFASHLIFGAAVIAVYAAYRALRSNTADQRGLYDWMCHAALLALFFALVTVPFGGYWLHREIYAYRQEMGITLLIGGILGSSHVILVILMATLFLAINYYLWQRIASMPGGRSYRPQAKWVFLLLAVCVMVYITPHTLVMRAAELKAIGGQQHPIIGNYGVEAPKQAAINIMTALTMWSVLIYRRSRYELKPGPSPLDAVLIAMFLVGAANIVWLGITGFYIPANIRVGQAVPMMMTILTIIIVGALLTAARVFRAKVLSPQAWGSLSGRGYLAVLVMAAAITWLMGIGGFQRSAVRLHWHVMEIFRDASPWTYMPMLGFSGNVIAFNTLLFWSALLEIIWLKGCVPSGERSRNVGYQQRLRPTGSPSSAIR